MLHASIYICICLPFFDCLPSLFTLSFHLLDPTLNPQSSRWMQECGEGSMDIIWTSLSDVWGVRDPQGSPHDQQHQTVAVVPPPAVLDAAPLAAAGLCLAMMMHSSGGGHDGASVAHSGVRNASSVRDHVARMVDVLLNHLLNELKPEVGRYELGRKI
jgi:hypothetical protein